MTQRRDAERPQIAEHDATFDAEALAAERSQQLQSQRELDSLRQAHSEETAALAAMCRDYRARIAVQEKILEAHKRHFAEADDLLRRLRQSHIFRLMRRLHLWEWLSARDEQVKDGNGISRFSSRQAGTGLHRVVVDLTPMLAGSLPGGAKVMTLELIRQLGRLAADCEFILLTSESSHEELAALEAPNVRRLCVVRSGPPLAVLQNVTSRARLAFAWFLRRTCPKGATGANRHASETRPARDSLVRQLGADLLFCPFTAPLFSDPAVPTVCVIYDLQHAYYPQFFDRAEILERDRNVEKAIGVASGIVCISEYARNSILENTAVAPDRVEAIPIRMPSRLGKPSAVECECVLKILQLVSGRFLLYPANFWPHKNHELLLTAFALYLAGHPGSDLRLVLTGSSGARQDFLKDAARRMDLSHAVVFPGYLSDEELSALLQSCMALIFPSLFEGFGMPLLEGMAAGRPVLCSNTTSLPEVAGGAALLFDPRKPVDVARAIARVATEPELRRELAAKGAQRAATFGGPEQMAASYWRTFRRAVERSADRPIASFGSLTAGSTSPAP